MIASWLVDQLQLQGVRHFCLAPGSRSSPLVQAAKQKGQIHVHFDERGLGFYALGLAKGLKEPVALIVTSGTAVGNLLPAIMEAHHSQTPLIVLTADRPLELRDCGANQATDQVKIFSSFARFQMDLSDAPEPAIRSIAAQSVFYACQNPPGPVHINCPFREPLHTVHTVPPGKAIPIHYPRLIAPPITKNTAKGLILIGRIPGSPAPILALANRLQWPVIGDVLSNARGLRYSDYNEKPTPELVLHFGERMTSKRLLTFLKEKKPEILHISPYPFLQDPERLLPERVQSDIEPFCASFEALTDPTWLPQWKDDPPLFSTEVFTETHAMQELARLIPKGFSAFFGSGMPIRDADRFFFPNHPCPIYANRGLSGIDGNIATIAGLAETTPLLAVIGDQAALYDLNSLALLKKTRHPVTLIISNNFGGGIFHHLPIAADPDFETLWAASHNLRFQKAAEMFELPYNVWPPKDWTQSQVVELITCRKTNHSYQTSLHTSS